MEVKFAQSNDIPAIMALLEACKIHMDQQGIHQWDTDYPNRRDVEADVAAQTAFILEISRSVAAVMTLDHDIPAEYHSLTWVIPARKVLVVHRLAVDPVMQGRDWPKS